jgi:hypothetical protein
MSQRLWPSAITPLLLALSAAPALADENPRKAAELLPPPKCCGVSEDCCAQVKGAEGYSGVAPCCAKRVSAPSDEEIAVWTCIAACGVCDAALLAMEIDCGPSWCWLQQLSDDADDCCAAHTQTGSCCVSPASAKAKKATGSCVVGCPVEGGACCPSMAYPAPAMMMGTGPCMPPPPVCMTYMASPPMPSAGPWPMPVALPPPPMPCPVPAQAIIRPSMTIRASQDDSQCLALIMETGPKPMGTVLVAYPECATCDKMVVNLTPEQQMRICTKGKQIEIEGAGFHAVADAVMVGGQHFAKWERDGAEYVHSGGPGMIGGAGPPVIVLDGHVRLCSQGDKECGAETQVTAEHLVLGVQGANIEIRLGWTAKAPSGSYTD